jgi:hypothetical protein
MQKLNANSKIDSVLDYLDPDRKKYANAEESSVHKAISALLAHNLTTIHCDTISEEYTIDNEKLHLTVFIYGSELKIRIVNTNKDVDYMFRRKFMKTIINDVIDKKNVVLDRIKSNADARTQKITDSIVAAIEKDLAKQP